jgi:hypothetical protein
MRAGPEIGRIQLQPQECGVQPHVPAALDSLALDDADAPLPVCAAKVEN